MKSICIMATALALAGGAAAAADKAALAEEGKGVIQAFGGALKAELTAAIEAKGPAHAVAVCNVKAPEIAARLGGETGWSVARSSHRLRNPKNAPDAYTDAAIKAFLEREAAGEKVADMAMAGIVEEEGQQVFRLVKAIPTGELCLNCHGAEQVKPEVEAALTMLYPEDKARGFAVGQMRGVFTLEKVLD